MSDITATILVSTGRKPAANTRRFAKSFAEFINGAYLNRGKSSLSELFEMGYERVLVVGQRSANPANLLFYINGKESLSLSMTLMQGEPHGRLKASDYVITGDSLADNLRRVLAVDSEKVDADKCMRKIVVDGTRIDFVIYEVTGHNKATKADNVQVNEIRLFSISIKYVTMGIGFAE